MNAAEGLQLLCNRLCDRLTDDSARDLLHALDYIPLAISQAVAYINQGARMTVKRYLEKFQKSKRDQENLLNWDTGELR